MIAEVKELRSVIKARQSARHQELTKEGYVVVAGTGTAIFDFGR
jgi:hypothetical protein